MDERILRESICEIGRLMYERGHVVTNDGNISARVDEKCILVTPAGVSKGRLEPDMLVPVSPDGAILGGDRHPSSEYKMHLEVFRQRTDVGAVIHAHSPVATAFAVARRPLVERFAPEMVLGLGEVPVAPFALPSTDEVPASIRPLIAGHRALLLANHGALTWGHDLFQAFDLLEQLEASCRLVLTVLQLGGGVELDDSVVKRLFELTGNYAKLAAKRDS